MACPDSIISMQCCRLVADYHEVCLPKPDAQMVWSSAAFLTADCLTANCPFVKQHQTAVSYQYCHCSQFEWLNPAVVSGGTQARWGQHRWKQL